MLFFWVCKNILIRQSSVNVIISELEFFQFKIWLKLRAQILSKKSSSMDFLDHIDMEAQQKHKVWLNALLINLYTQTKDQHVIIILKKY